MIMSNHMQDIIIALLGHSREKRAFTCDSRANPSYRVTRFKTQLIEPDWQRVRFLLTSSINTGWLDFRYTNIKCRHNEFGVIALL